MLATRTLDGLSVEDLAARAEISRGLLFHYFRATDGSDVDQREQRRGEQVQQRIAVPDAPVDRAHDALLDERHPAVHRKRDPRAQTIGR
jgi:AcrR family transcriptional regulator